MGRTSRWFKSLLGGKKEAKQASHADPSLSNTKDKRRWSFGKSSKDRPVHQEHRVPYVDNNYMCDAENEQNRHAVAVAAATAAAADAAVAAAQAAVAVVRLTSNGRLSLYSGRERWAAIRIQTLFRGYLARRALRALKGLVKLQALVRGYLVRKQADATLYCMQSLVRIQARVRAQRLWLSEEAPGTQMYQKKRTQEESRPRKSTERWNAGVDNATYYSQSRRGFAYGFPQQEMETNLDESAKIVEIDTFRPKVRSKRRVCLTSDSGSAEPSISSTAGRYSMPNFTLQSSSPPENEGSITAKYVSPLKACFSTRVSIRSPASDDLSSIDLNGDWASRGEDYKFLTAKSSPQFCSSASKFGVTSTSTFTPSKIEYAHNYSQGYCAFPNYMSNTESSRAKVRSQSVPKQRPDDKTAFLVKRRTSLQEAAETRSSFSGVRTQSSCFQAQETCNAYQHLGPARLDRPTMSFRDSECDRFHSQWW